MFGRAYNLVRALARELPELGPIFLMRPPCQHEAGREEETAAIRRRGVRRNEMVGSEGKTLVRLAICGINFGFIKGGGIRYGSRWGSEREGGGVGALYCLA